MNATRVGSRLEQTIENMFHLAVILIHLLNHI